MTTRVCCVVVAALVLAVSPALAQDQDIPLKNWTAPPYWKVTVITANPGPEGQMEAGVQEMTAQAQALPSSPLPFVAITPCRIVDTRVAVSDGFHQPNFIDNETRTFTLPSSPDCTGLPSTAGAWSLNVQFRPISVASYITLFPTGTTRPLVSTLTATPAGFTADAALVPAGTGGAIDVYCQYAGRVVIDINGYYGPQSVVTSLNTLNGALTLAPGSNIAITPSAGTLTIAMTGVPGGTLPAGAAGQTLYSNGSGWIASSALTNDGANVGVTGTLNLPATTAASIGVIAFGNLPFVHDYAGPGTDGLNTFVGQYAGNFTMGGSTTDGSYNVAVGMFSLHSDTTGSGNTASGFESLGNNTTGLDNTATGNQGLLMNTTGSGNTATGYRSLVSNTTGAENTASGLESLYSNSTGGSNTATGAWSLNSNTLGSWNTAEGYQSLRFNTTGIENTADGFQSLYNNTTGQKNTVNGLESLFDNTTGNLNTASGYFAGFYNVSGSSNTFVGANSDPAAGDLTNATALGANAVVDASNHVRIGDTNVTQIGGQVAWSNLSDARAKTDIRDLDLGLDFVMALHPVAFSLKTGDGRTDMGFIAQDIEAVLGDGYGVLGIGGDSERTLSLRYTDLIAPLVKAIQEQQGLIVDQAKTMKAQQAEIEALKSAAAARDATFERIVERLAAVEARLASR